MRIQCGAAQQLGVGVSCRERRLRLADTLEVASAGLSLLLARNLDDLPSTVARTMPPRWDRLRMGHPWGCCAVGEGRTSSCCMVKGEKRWPCPQITV